jgi:uncharacterized alpha-E superfamily protein
MNNLYLQKIFLTAVYSMATSPKPIQGRIADAYVYHLIGLKPDEFPEEIRYQFTELKNTLSTVEPNGDEGSIATTTSQMSEDKAVATAQEIVNMADWLMRWNPPLK